MSFVPGDDPRERAHRDLVVVGGALARQRCGVEPPQQPHGGAPVPLEQCEQVAVGDLPHVRAVKRRVLGGVGPRDRGGGHAAFPGRLGRAGLPAGALIPRTRASLAWASGIRRISFSRWSRYPGLWSAARSSPRNGWSRPYTRRCSPFTSANICSSIAPCSTNAAVMVQYVVTMR